MEKRKLLSQKKALQRTARTKAEQEAQDRARQEETRLAPLRAQLQSEALKQQMMLQQAQAEAQRAQAERQRAAAYQQLNRTLQYEQYYLYQNSGRP